MDKLIVSTLAMSLAAEAMAEKEAEARRKDRSKSTQRVTVEFNPIIDGYTDVIPENEESVLIRYADEAGEDMYEVLTFYKAGTEVTLGYKNLGKTREEKLINLLTNDSCRVKMKIEKSGFYVWESDEKDKTLSRPRLININNISHWAKLPKTKSREE